MADEENPTCSKCGASFYTDPILRSHYANVHCVKKFYIPIPNSCNPHYILLFETQEDVDFYNAVNSQVITAPGWYYKKWIESPSCCGGFYRLAPFHQLLEEVQAKIDNATTELDEIKAFLSDTINKGNSND